MLPGLSALDVKRELADADGAGALDPRKRARATPPPPPAGFGAGIGAKQELEARLNRLVGGGASVPAPPPPMWASIPAPPPAVHVQNPVSMDLFAALQRLGRDRASALDAAGAGPSAPAPTAQGQDIGSALKGALGGLLNTGALAEAAQSSGAGGALFNIVQDLTVKEEPVNVKEERVKRERGVKREHAVKSEGGVSLKEELRQHRMGGGLPPRPVVIDADVLDGEDADDAPHRLPANFGAIPEDLLIERAQAKEDERIRRIKATQPCRFGRQCKKRDCPNMHPEGREIDTMLNLCSFGRRCKRMNCFYDHPEGRELDNDPTKGSCKWGKKCKRADCLYGHPEGREPVAGPDLRICFFCHSAGHIASDCPQNPESFAFDASRDREKQLANAPAEEGAAAPDVAATAEAAPAPAAPVPA